MNPATLALNTFHLLLHLTLQLQSYQTVFALV
jgi:hypothetical protein